MGFLFFKAHYENIGYQRAVKEQKNAIAKITKIQTKVIKQIETVYVPKLKVIHEVGKTIYKEVPVYVTPANDRQCTINNGFVRLWNYANQSVPPTVSSTDEDASKVKLSEVAAEHAREAELCNANTEQLIGLIKQVKALHAATKHP